MGLVSKKPHCKQDEKWPLMLDLRKGQARGSGGGYGEWGAGGTSFASGPANSFVHRQGCSLARCSDFLKLEKDIIMYMLLIFRC